ncbi:MAG: hypothetical protein AAGF60_02335 [Pseudomonadota bacterium]
MSALATPLQRGLPFAFCGYVLAVVLMHLLLPATWLWPIAYVALLGMLFTYPAHAAVQGAHRRLEVGVSLAFAAVGLIGLLTAPGLLVAAIAAHGVLDTVKHFGLGARVPFWYLSGCAVFDLAYAGLLAMQL